MTANPQRAPTPPDPEGEVGSYAGWYIGGAVIVVVLAVGIGLWFVYHP